MISIACSGNVTSVNLAAFACKSANKIPYFELASLLTVKH